MLFYWISICQTGLVRTLPGYLRAPILVISGNSRVDDRITALGAGADGYLTKPFDRYELPAHPEAIIRRANGHASTLIKAGNLMMDLSRNLISIDGKFVPLTQKEYQIVNLLCMRKGAVLSKESFISYIYGGIDEPDSKSLMCLSANYGASWKKAA